MVYSIERREHDLNVFRAKTTEQAESHKEAYNLMLVELKSELETVKIEKDRLQTLWLEAQKQMVNDQAKYNALFKEHDMLQVYIINQTRLGITEGVKVKTDRSMAEIKEESFEHKLEAAKLFNELRKIQPVISELQERNV